MALGARQQREKERDLTKPYDDAKRTPELTRKVKNCNVPRIKIKSAIFGKNPTEWNDTS